MNSGELNELVEVLEDQTTGKKNKLDEDILEKVVIGKFFAKFENRTGNMLYGRSGDSKLANTTHKVSYRYANFPNLDETYILRIRNQLYKIEYIDNLNNTDEIMEVFISRDNLRKRRV